MCKGTGECFVCEGNGCCPDCWGLGQGSSDYAPKWCPSCQGACNWFVCNNCGTDVSTYEYLTDEYDRDYRYCNGVVSRCGRCGATRG